jgi:TM2 domain-containing membrane protein YozV/Tfp pilus assembly protein PilE
MGMVHCRGCGQEIHETAVTCPKCGAPQQVATTSASIKSQTAATLFAAFLGGLGGHKFYLGKPVWGVVYLLFCWTGLPGLIAFIEALLMMFMSQQKWAEKYNNGQLSAPVHIAVKLLALVFPVVFIVGIAAAIAIPQFAEYTKKAKTKEIQSAVRNLATTLIANSTSVEETRAALKKLENSAISDFSSAEVVVKDNGVITIKPKDATIAEHSAIFVPSEAADGSVTWRCQTNSRVLQPTCASMQ